MKLLAFTDIHGSPTALKRIEQKVKKLKPDLLVCSGDISIFEHGISAIFKRMSRMDKKIIMVHGNHEDESTFKRHSRKFKNLIFIHKKHFLFEDALFLGYGGGGFSLTDREFEKFANKEFKKIDKDNPGKKIFLVTHGPPYKTRLDSIGRSHVGNKSFRKFIESNNIDYHICGHLHENFGKEDKIKKTRVINPGPFGKMIKFN